MDNHLKVLNHFSFEVTAQSVGLVKIELYAHVEINTYADLNIVEQKNPISKAEANRLLAGYFLELTPQKRENVANQLGLLPDKHYDVPRIELAKMIFQKARETNKLAQLWDEVLETHPNKSEILNKLNLFTNPFNNEISESCILENQTPKTQ